MTTTRTQKQRDANDLDRDLYNLSERLEQFAADHDLRASRLQKIDDAASAVRWVRWIVREQMHPEDAERTRGL